MNLKFTVYDTITAIVVECASKKPIFLEIENDEGVKSCFKVELNSLLAPALIPVDADKFNALCVHSLI